MVKARNVYAGSLLSLALLGAIVAALWASTSQADAQEGPQPARLDLVVPNVPFDFLPDALPNAGGTVTVTPSQGTDEFAIEVEGLPPNAEYVVFLTETPTAPFGEVQYLLDLTTDASGSGTATARAAIFEAFSLTGSAKGGMPDVEAIQASKTELDHVVVWPAEPETTAPLFEEQGEEPAVSPFDADLEAGPAVLTDSNNPEAPSPLEASGDDAASGGAQAGAASLPDTGGISPAAFLPVGAILLILGAAARLFALRRRGA